jgi:hypothetical protein
MGVDKDGSAMTQCICPLELLLALKALFDMKGWNSARECLKTELVQNL